MLALLALLAGAAAAADERPTMESVLGAAGPEDWRRPAPEDLLLMTLAGGEAIVIELAPHLAPAHVENIRRLAAEGYFDGLAILRSQDNYVVQWGDPDAGTDSARDFGAAADALAPEFSRPAGGLPFTGIDSRDPYANEVGFSLGFPVGRDRADGRAWGLHCYAMVGVGRGNDPASGNGSQLYVVIGHAPRHLDRNVTLVGRVVHGIEHLSTLPRGGGPLGFYEQDAERVAIESMRVMRNIAASERPRIERLRTVTRTFEALVEARRHRAEEWFIDPADRIGVCNVPLPARVN